jgi:cell division protein FtsZ
MGKAMMGTGEATGENRAINAAEEAVSNPLLDDTSIENARGVIINISGGEDVKLYEIDEIAAYIKKQCREDVNLIVGNTIEKIEDGKIRVSLLASGIAAESAIDNDDNEKFIKPRLVSISNVDKQENTIKDANINKEEKKQADLEDFLSKEVNRDIIDNEDSNRSINENFFIPSEEVLPNKIKDIRTDPFKEADMLNADVKANSKIIERMEEVENNSLISRLTNVKEKVLNAGSNAISMVSEVANKSLENKFSRKEENQEAIKNETESSNRVEPSFLESSSSKLESTSAMLDQNKNINEHGFDNIPSFLKRNRD